MKSFIKEPDSVSRDILRLENSESPLGNSLHE